LCDEPVDPNASVNADRGPSVDSGASAKGKKATAGAERMAHRACNTRRGAVKPIVAWSSDLFVVEPAPIVATVDRLTRKGGREVVARCPSRADADQAAVWLLDRLSRFAPGLAVTTQVEAGGGQFLLVLRTK
jgi:ferric-dicitrate binding protein FerR (iron transport regulator)